MIQTKKDLSFYIAADRIMNGYPPYRNIGALLKESFIIGGGRTIVIRYLRHLRKYAYYYNTHKRTLSWNTIMLIYEHYKVAKLGVKCGFSIGPNSLDYGIVIPHYGTIVVNENSHVGPFSVLHTCTCIAGGGKEIGEAFYLSSGSQLVGEFTLGNNVSVGAHSMVNKTFKDNILIAGCPAFEVKSNYLPWYERDGVEFSRRVANVKKLLDNK